MMGNGNIYKLPINNYNCSLILRNVMYPVITPGTDGTESQSFATDYKSDIDIDTHKSVNLLDTDYRPDYDGKLISIIHCYKFIFIIYRYLSIL